MISPGHGESHFVRGRAMPHFALLLVVLHGVQAVAQLVAALVKSRTGRDDFDEAEAFFLKRLADGSRELPDVKGGPAGDVHCACGFDQVRQIESGSKVPYGVVEVMA